MSENAAIEKIRQFQFLPADIAILRKLQKRRMRNRKKKLRMKNTMKRRSMSMNMRMRRRIL